MIRKKICMFLCITASAIALIGCQEKETAVVQEKETNLTEDSSSITGQVTAVDGSSITLALVDMERQGGGMPEGEDGEMPEREEGMTGDMPEREEGMTGDKPEGEMPEGMTGDMPERPEGETGDMPQGGRMSGFELSGETQTITVSDSTTYQIQEMNETKEGSLSDIEEDSILRVVMDGDEVTSVTIMQMGEGGRATQSEPETEATL